MKLCCFFNYAPLYRESIYKAIDEAFDTQFYFGKEVEYGKKSGIAKLNYAIFRKKPIEFENRTFLKYFSWRTKAAWIALKKYDTFLVTGDFVFSYIPLIFFCKLLGKRVYGWGHGLKTRKGKMRTFNDFFYHNLSGFFTYGERGRKRLIDLGFDSSKIFTIYNSLNAGTKSSDNELLSSDIYSSHFANTNPTIIFIGRLIQDKKIDWLVKSILLLKQNGFKCNLMIIGDGPEKYILEELARTYDIEDQCWFYGACYDESQLNKLIYNATLCVSPGNIGLTALHALTYGVPVISHNNFETQGPEYETIVEGKTGSLYKERDFENFIATLTNWLYNFANREQIRQNCYSMINEKWNSDYQIEILKKILYGD